MYSTMVHMCAQMHLTYSPGRVHRVGAELESSVPGGSSPAAAATPPLELASSDALPRTVHLDRTHSRPHAVSVRDTCTCIYDNSDG